MPTSNDPKDLFNPGAAQAFFTAKGLPPFDPAQTKSFSRSNALWLAEFSRLIYRQGTDEVKNARSPNRAGILGETGWKETDFFLRNDSKAAFFVNETLECACLVFRGTLGLTDMVSDVRFITGGWQGKGQVHTGFKSCLDSVWPRIESRLKEIPFPVFFTGHSLGGALATLAAARVLHNPALTRPAALYTFGSPRVGDDTFARIFHDLFHCRMVNDHDIVTSVPPAFSLLKFPVFQHTGEMHRLLPDGVMEVFPNGFDMRDTRNPLAGVRDFAGNIARFVGAALGGRGSLPQSLLDHAPVNYVARLEEVAPASPGGSPEAPELQTPGKPH